MSHHKNSDCFLQESNDVCSQWGTDPKKDQRLLLDLMRSRIRSRRVISIWVCAKPSNGCNL